MGFPPQLGSRKLFSTFDGEPSESPRRFGASSGLGSLPGSSTLRLSILESRVLFSAPHPFDDLSGGFEISLLDGLQLRSTFLLHPLAIKQLQATWIWTMDDNGTIQLQVHGGLSTSVLLRRRIQPKNPKQALTLAFDARNLSPALSAS